MTDKKSGRYTVSSDEGFEPGSNDEVLKNKLGIRSREEMEALEESELARAEMELIKLFDENHQFTVEDICNVHDLWLDDVYLFAGKYRTVNIAKGDFNFAAANRIEYSMGVLEKDFLSKYTPCHYTDLDELAHAIGVVHVELILIHPFREGNGRVARLLADLMSMQAGRPPLNYLSIDQNVNAQGFNNYILAIHAGLVGNYEPIKEIFKAILMESLT